MSAIYNYVWPQGADLPVGFRYYAGEDGEETPVNLTGYSVRMDLVHPQTKEVLFTFNSNSDDGPVEVTINDIPGRVMISVPRSLTLPPTEGETPSAVYQAMQDGVLTFNYDIFLRDTNDKQIRVYGGKITVDPSHTLWR